MAGFLRSLGVDLVDVANRPCGGQSLGASDVVALYFSAHWCPPCRQFTPMLKKFVETLQSAGDASLKVIFVSRDKSEVDMWKYIHEAHGNWFAVPFASDARESLCHRYAVSGIPALVVLNQVGQPAVPMQSAVSQVMGAAASSTQVLSTYFQWRSAVGVPPAAPAAQTERCDQLPPGARVRLRGLVGAAEHNGETGEVVAYDAAKQRYTVRFGSEKSLALRAANLLQLAAVRVRVGDEIDGAAAEEWADAEVVDFDDETGALSLQRSGKGAKPISARLDDEGLLLNAGTRVAVHGLQAESAKQWNERLGTVIEHDASAKRYVVEVAPGTRLKIKPESLRLCPLG